MIKFQDLKNNKFNLSPHQLNILDYNNKNVFSLSSLLSREIQKKDNGIDIGSNQYINSSDYKFLKTKVANKNSYIIDLSNTDSYEYMNYNSYLDQDLREGDIILSKDSNIGESCILDKDYPNCMIASAFYKLPLSTNKYYIFSFLKNDHFKNQLDSIVPKGATIRHAGTKFLDCKIPFPNGKEADKLISLIEFLTKCVIEKEKQIILNETKIFEIISAELLENSHVSNYNLPKINDLIEKNRIDAGYYSEEIMEIISKIKNYKNGYKTIKDFGYNICRGQNLQVSCIGRSIETSEFYKGFYKVAKPTDLTNYGTVSAYNYIGNKNVLSTLNEGDIVFSAEGTIGKCAMFSNLNEEKIITNIHGIILNKENHDVTESAFVCSFLRYLREIKYFDYLSVGGQGGSLAMKYWDDVIIPIFPQNIVKKISELYFSDKHDSQDLFDYKSYDYSLNKELGIVELSDNIKRIKKVLDELFNNIVNNEYFDYTDACDFIKNQM